MVNTLAELDAFGVSFASVMDPFDGTTTQGKLLMHLVSAFSEFKRQVLSSGPELDWPPVSTTEPSDEN